MQPKIGTMMKASPDLTGLDGWVKGDVIDVEQNPFKGLVVAIKDNMNRIFFGEAKYFLPA